MAKRKANNTRTAGGRKRRAAGAPGSPPHATGEPSTPGTPQAGSPRPQAGTRFWIASYLAVFVVVQLIIVFVFVVAGGDSRVQRQMLLRAESFAESGRYDRAVATLEAFGERWPGAYQTHDFNRGLGEYHLAAGDSGSAARFLRAAVDANPDREDTRALAGLALWELGRRDDAVAMFRSEIESGNPNNDTANYHLGVHLLEQGRVGEAFAYFGAINDREGYAGRLRAAREEVFETYIEPARRQAMAGAAGGGDS